MRELLDEVDENDQLTGKSITKQQAHDGRLFHRCSVIYVFTQDNNLYLQVHKKSGNRLDHSAGGHVKSGETYLQAAQRELHEELGLILPLRKVRTHFLSKERQFVHLYGIYRCTVVNNWTFKPNKEVDEMRIVSVRELAKDIDLHPENYTSGLINTLPELLKSKNA